METWEFLTLMLQFIKKNKFYCWNYFSMCNLNYIKLFFSFAFVAVITRIVLNFNH